VPKQRHFGVQARNLCRQTKRLPAGRQGLPNRNPNPRTLLLLRGQETHTEELKSRRKEVISMKKAIIFGLGLVLSLALVATVAMAWGPGFGPGFGRGFGGPAFDSPPIPNLTSEQSAQIQALRDAFLKEIEPLQNDLWTK